MNLNKKVDPDKNFIKSLKLHISLYFNSIENQFKTAQLTAVQSIRRQSMLDDAGVPLDEAVCKTVFFSFIIFLFFFFELFFVRLFLVMTATLAFLLAH